MSPMVAAVRDRAKRRKVRRELTRVLRRLGGSCGGEVILFG